MSRAIRKPKNAAKNPYKKVILSILSMCSVEGVNVVLNGYNMIYSSCKDVETKYCLLTININVVSSRKHH